MVRNLMKYQMRGANSSGQFNDSQTAYLKIKFLKMSYKSYDESLMFA